ncbi:hypothetical protein, partial [Rhizobium johnstonii]|uniref:hypothetical protein n=1 Tax=Rhizobium johnstonii TaxID=3019933 RepID=UPI003F99557F
SIQAVIGISSSASTPMRFRCATTEGWASAATVPRSAYGTSGWRMVKGRSQHGNNNAYCQDNEINWLDWKALDGDLI